MEASRPVDETAGPVEHVKTLVHGIRARDVRVATVQEGDRFTTGLRSFMPERATGPARMIDVGGTGVVYVGQAVGTAGSPSRSRDIVRVLAGAGIRVLVILADAEALDEVVAGSSAAPVRDHVNLWPDNPLVGPNDEAVGPRFPDMSEAYDPAIRETMATAVASSPARSIVLASTPDPGVLAAGPDASRWRALGVEAVTRGVVPLVVAARHAGMRVACLAAFDVPPPGWTEAAFKAIVRAV